MDEDGWVKNVTTGGTNDAHKGWGARAAASADFGDSVTWDLTADYIYDENPFIPFSYVSDDRVSRSGLQQLGAILPGARARSTATLSRTDLRRVVEPELRDRDRRRRGDFRLS